MMPVTYRTLHPHEEEAVLRLWVEVFNEDREPRARIFGDFADAPQRFARTQVAVAEDGTILSATAYWLRELRDLNGAPCRTGHLWGVATRPDERRQGHVSKLLDLTLQAMQQEGCTWSILFARAEARNLYTRAGWQAVPSTYRSGILAESPIKADDSYTIQTFDPHQEPQGWARLAKIYAEENAQRPLTMIRGLAYWQGYAAWMMADWLQNYRAKVLIATPTTTRDDWQGYVIAHFYDADYAKAAFDSPPWFYISEIGARANDPKVTATLLRAVAAMARQQGMGYAQMVLPDEVQINVHLKELFGETLQAHEAEGSMMIRTLSPTAPKLPLPNDGGTGFFWGLDQF